MRDTLQRKNAALAILGNRALIFDKKRTLLEAEESKRKEYLTLNDRVSL